MCVKCQTPPKRQRYTKTKIQVWHLQPRVELAIRWSQVERAARCATENRLFACCRRPPSSRRRCLCSWTFWWANNRPTCAALNQTTTKNQARIPTVSPDVFPTLLFIYYLFIIHIVHMVHCTHSVSSKNNIKNNNKITTQKPKLRLDVILQ